MDETELLCEIALALNGIITFCLSAQYLLARKLYNSFKAALNNGINSVNVNKINHDEPSYCVVRGRVKALAPLIKSLNKPSEAGVIQNLTIKEHSTRRFNGVWENDKSLLDSKYNVIPFELEKENFRITVSSPLKAVYLNLPVIENHFEPSDASLIGFICGLHPKGFQYTEYLLKENDILTGFGEVIIGDNQKLLLVPPKNGMDYILSTLDPETLAIQLESNKIFYRIWATVFGITGALLIGILIFKWRKKKRAEQYKKELLEMATRARLERQRKEPHNELREEPSACIICLNQRREVILLPCGHISMCFDCAHQCADRPCPICRQKVSSIHLIYFS